MPRKPAQRMTIAKRQHEVSNLYIQGMTQWEIAERLGTSEYTVGSDLAKVREQWRKDISRDLGEQLARIDRIEAVAWEAWERSCEDAETKVKRTEKAPAGQPKGQDGKAQGPYSLFNPDGVDGVGERAPAGGLAAKIDAVNGNAKLVTVRETEERRTVGQCGNPAYLDRVAWCVDTRLKILGAYKVSEVNLNQTNVTVELSDDDRNAAAAALVARFPQLLNGALGGGAGVPAAADGQAAANGRAVEPAWGDLPGDQGGARPLADEVIDL